MALILIDFQIEDPNQSSNSGNDGNSTEQKSFYHPVSLDTRDLQGRTALHIASEQGHVEMIKLLKQKMTERDPSGTAPIGFDAPQDLIGRTPMGWAETSTEPKAKENKEALRNELFSPGDVSVYGAKSPFVSRTGGSRSHCQKTRRNGLDLWYGYSEMPGLRIEMEDAMCHEYPLALPCGKGGSEGESNDVKQIGFFGVFDGHGPPSCLGWAAATYNNPSSYTHLVTISIVSAAFSQFF